jgi:hypothetical protein
MTKILKRTLMSISQAALLTCLFIDLSAATAPFPEEEGAQARPSRARRTTPTALSRAILRLKIRF